MDGYVARDVVVTLGTCISGTDLDLEGFRVIPDPSFSTSGPPQPSLFVRFEPFVIQPPCDPDE